VRVGTEGREATVSRTNEAIGVAMNRRRSARSWRSRTRLGCWFLAAMLSLVGHVSAEIYFAPDNVLDPAKRTMAGSSDASLPYIYIEPHECCFDISEPLLVTIYAVNRSGGNLTIDWNSILGALSLEAVGPGTVTPKNRGGRLAPATIPQSGLGSHEINLKDFFGVRGASVYRLSFSKPLEDGRIHFAKPVTFLVEDAAALEKFGESLEAGPGRNTAVDMLKRNPIFASGTEPKTYGNDAWWQEPEMTRIEWAGSITAARACWESGMDELTKREAAPEHLRALEALVDRILLLSDDFRVPPAHELFPWKFRADDYLPPKAREEI
jgi:hypothetical protein